MAGKKKQVSISLSQELLKKLKIYQQKQKIKSPEEAIAAALQTFFEQSNHGDADAPLDRLMQLEAQVDRLTEQIADLQFVVPSAVKMPVQFDRPSSEPQAIDSVSNNHSYEDFEDEPDEILYDFIE